LAREQVRRLKHFDAGECVDIHCHCLPGVDDGPADLRASIALCRLLVADGITTAIATPHQLGRYDGHNDGESINEAVSALRVALIDAGVPLAVEPGADVRIDERIVPLLSRGEVLGLGPTGRYVLLELPHETFVDLRRLIEDLESAGRKAVLSHPERHPFLARRPELVVPWIEAGVVLQITSGSLVGAFGPQAEAAAWNWLTRGQAHLIASDAHDTRMRPPRMTPALDRVERRLGQAIARQLCIDNPIRVLRGDNLLTPQAATTATAQQPVLAVPSRGRW
jgi:protein-tyrosine phosphatase